MGLFVEKDGQTHFCSFLLFFLPISCVSVSIETFKDYRNQCDISCRRVQVAIEEFDPVTGRRERFTTFFYASLSTFH